VTTAEKFTHIAQTRPWDGAAKSPILGDVA